MSNDNLICGHTWESIQRAQQGGKLNNTVISGNPEPVTAKPEFIELYKLHGLDGLEKMQLFGVIDNLKQSGYLK